LAARCTPARTACRQASDSSVATTMWRRFNAFLPWVTPEPSQVVMKEA
jgi:hypothetical protein